MWLGVTVGSGGDVTVSVLVGIVVGFAEGVIGGGGGGALGRGGCELGLGTG